MKSIDEQIATAQKAVESSQARLKRLKHQRADKLLKAENEALKAKYEALTAGLGELVRQLSNEAKWTTGTGEDGNKIKLVRLDYVQSAIKKLLVGE